MPITKKMRYINGYIIREEQKKGADEEKMNQA